MTHSQFKAAQKAAYAAAGVSPGARPAGPAGRHYVGPAGRRSQRSAKGQPGPWHDTRASYRTPATHDARWSVTASG